MKSLPPYTVRVSRRAKRLQLKVKPPNKVEVVVPQRMSTRHAAAFVAEHSEWLDQTLQQMAQDYPAQPMLPQDVVFPLLNERWRVEYRDIEDDRIYLNVIERPTAERSGLLRLDSRDEQVCRQLLQSWLQDHARHALTPLLEKVSADTCLSYNRLTVRGQKSRWGSCSAQKNINLNRALLFLEPITVRYLMIHELCHTIHLNHSPRYWQLVEHHMPGYKAVDRSLRRAMSTIPHWALPD